MESTDHISSIPKNEYSLAIIQRVHDTSCRKNLRQLKVLLKELEFINKEYKKFRESEQNL